MPRTAVAHNQQVGSRSVNQAPGIAEAWLAKPSQATPTSPVPLPNAVRVSAHPTATSARLHLRYVSRPVFHRTLDTISLQHWHATLSELAK